MLIPALEDCFSTSLVWCSCMVFKKQTFGVVRLISDSVQCQKQEHYDSGRKQGEGRENRSFLGKSGQAGKYGWDSQGGRERISRGCQVAVEYKVSWHAAQNWETATSNASPLSWPQETATSLMVKSTKMTNTNTNRHVLNRHVTINNKLLCILRH